MERPERPSRHSKTHDKWKRIIEPAGDSDSSSDWSTDATCQENDLLLRSSFYDVPPSNIGGSDGAGPSTSSGTGMSDTLMNRVRMRGIIPNHDISSLLARYSSERHKRPAPTTSDLDATVDPPSYHLLHHDYAERDADHSTYRDLPKYSVSRTHCSRTNPNNDYSYFLHSSSPNGERERKRGRLHRHQPTSSADQQHDSRPSRTEPEDSDRELYIIRLPSPSHNDNATAATDLRDDDVISECHVHGERSGRSCPSNEFKLKFLRRPGHSSSVLHGGNGTPASAGSSATGGSASGERSPFSRSFYAELPPLSERSTAAIAAARHDAASTSSAEVQVISMAGPSRATTPPRNATERPAERAGPGDDEIIVIVEDQNTPAVDAANPQVPIAETPAPATATRPPPKPTPSTSTTTPTAEDDSLNQHLISLLECPVCTEYMAPPIHQCRRGHLLCATCKPKLPQCPTCRSRFTDSRNLAMEQVADRLLYPCKNRELEAGCAAQLRLKDKPEHEANCAFRAYPCTLPMCSWKGLKDEVFPHSLAVHRDVLLTGNKQELMVNVGDLNSTVYRNWLVSAYDELFRVNFMSPKRSAAAISGTIGHLPRQHVFGCVQFIGPRSGANRFKYTIETRRDDANRCLRYTRNTHSDLRRCAHIYSAVDCFHMRGETSELVCERRDGAFLLPAVITISLNSANAGDEN